MITLSLVAVIYVGLVAMVQKDMKKLVAYSSVAHMGFVTLGFFIFSDLGVSGGIVQMIAHGFVSAAMFLCIGVLYDRVHSREIASYGGVVNTMPKFAAFALLFSMANCGLPATAGFVGEWMVILAAVKANFWLGLGAATALIFGAAYTLWMFKRVYLGAGGQRRREGPHRHQPARVPDADPAGDPRALYGRVPEAVHRCHEQLGGRAAQACGAFQVELRDTIND
jgi:NADH-quinone oxidoreductase subunit M